MIHVGIDIGGTFTDLMLLDRRTRAIAVGKILTTPRDPSVGALTGLRECLEEQGIGAPDVETIIHGTTLIANALIERRGARTGLVTTEGFRDVLEIGREKRYDVYDIFLEMPEPLVPRLLRLEVPERIDKEGRVVTPLDAAAAEEAVHRLVAEGVESVAVCFLHSFRNPAHERQMREIIGRVAPTLFVSLSHEVMPEIREYERTSTTAANAYTQPLMKRYLTRFQRELEALRFRGSFYIMLSGGGITTPDVAAEVPVRVVESGPAAGAIAASFFGTLCKAPKVLSFDMGGTTAKACLIEDGTPRVATDFEVARVYRFKKGSGLPIRLPVIEMIEIGAGGGSIATIDAMGLLKVGPQSAGADPGPACYNLGGTEPTVTDADLILGYLDPRFFLGGKMALDLDRARAAIAEKVGRPLGIDVVEAAHGIHQVVNENMANAARIHAVDKGQDPKHFTMVAFGGAGPVHAYGVCERLGITDLIVPLRAGVISALGFLLAPISFDFVRTRLAPLPSLTGAEITAMFREMEDEATRMLARAHVPKGEITVTRTCEMHYQGQGHEIVVPIPNGTLTDKHLPLIARAYDEVYERLYHRTIPGAIVETLNWRLVARGPMPVTGLEKGRPRRASRGRETLKGKRDIYFRETGGFVSTPVYDRYRLTPGAEFRGPAVIEERESTTVVGPRARVEVDPFFNLRIARPSRP